MSAWWEDDVAREKHALELLSAAGRLSTDAPLEIRQSDDTAVPRTGQRQPLSKGALDEILAAKQRRSVARARYRAAWDARFSDFHD